MAAASQSQANFDVQGEVTTGYPSAIDLSSTVAPSLKALIRKLVAQARNGPEARVNGSNGPKGQVIIDAEVDGVRCLLTRLEKPPPSRISFSPREREIAQMIAKGYPNKTIAALLEISSWTVCTHLRRIFSKLGVSSRAAMVARMMDAGIFGCSPERDSRDEGCRV